MFSNNFSIILEDILLNLNELISEQDKQSLEHHQHQHHHGFDQSTGYLGTTTSADLRLNPKLVSLANSERLCKINDNLYVICREYCCGEFWESGAAFCCSNNFKPMRNLFTFLLTALVGLFAALIIILLVESTIKYVVMSKISSLESSLKKEITLASNSNYEFIGHDINNDDDNKVGVGQLAPALLRVRNQRRQKRHHRPYYRWDSETEISFEGEEDGREFRENNNNNNANDEDDDDNDNEGNKLQKERRNAAAMLSQEKSKRRAKQMARKHSQSFKDLSRMKSKQRRGQLRQAAARSPEDT